MDVRTGRLSGLRGRAWRSLLVVVGLLALVATTNPVGAGEDDPVASSASAGTGADVVPVFAPGTDAGYAQSVLESL